MTDETRDAIKTNVEHSKRCLISAEILLNADDNAGAINRLYYCVFHCVRALLSNDDVEFKKHSGVISYFRREYIKTQLLPSRLSDIIDDLFNNRNESDYDDNYFIDKEDVAEKIKDAEFFLNEISQYLTKIGAL